MKTLQELVTNIARSLVDNPDAVKVREVEGLRTSVIELKVAKGDLGKIIGRKGRTADAIRTILKAASGRQRKRVGLEIIE